MLCYPIAGEEGKGPGKGTRARQAGCWGNNLGLPPSPSQVSKLRFREFHDLPSFICSVNANEDVNSGVPPKSKGCLPETSSEICGNNMEFCGKPQKQVAFANCLSGKVCSSLGSHTGRVTLTPTKRSRKAGCVCVCGGGETVSILQEALLSHTPESNCKNDILGPGFIPSSTSYLLRLQGKDDFSLCQGRTFPACDLKIMLCSFCLLTHPRP